MLKVSFYPGETEYGHSVVPLFHKATDPYFEKVAAAHLLPEVVRYIETLRPSQDACYNLVNAMGAGEFFGSNINGDYFTEASLIHRPDDWTGNPLIDKIKAKDWAYGFPTFYYAHPFAHHRNKDASRAFGEVELAVWNDRMKRVELVTRVDKDKCQQFGGTQVWDKLVAGMYPDVSMGCKVPFDTSSITLDWDLYRKAQATFDPRKHKTPGDAVLEFHKRLQRERGHGIRGLSVTRKDYDEFTLKNLNRILPDGRKVFVYNDYPKFFDISFVFVGADKTAKTMMKIAGDARRFWSVPSVELAEKLGYDEQEERTEKVASVEEDALKLAFLGKSAKSKQGEIVKDVVPSQFAGKAIPLLTRNEPDIPDALLQALGRSSLEEALSTPTGLGMVLRPREFQKIILIRIGKSSLADDLEAKDVVFPRVEEEDAAPMGPEFFNPALARMLAVLLSSRSALGPAIEQRVTVAAGRPAETAKRSSSHSSELLHKIGAAYNGYRRGVMELVANSQNLMNSMAHPSDFVLSKFAAASVEATFTPLAAAYLQQAFWDEVGVCSLDGSYVKTSQASAGVERGSPSRNTWSIDKHVSGGRKP